MTHQSHAKKPDTPIPPAQTASAVSIPNGALSSIDWEKIRIPVDQKQALTQAILTLVSVILGILLTLLSQVITQAIMPEAPAPVEVPLDLSLFSEDRLGSDPLESDPLQALGSTHFTDVYADNAAISTLLTAAAANISGAVTADALTLENGEAIGNATDGVIDVGGFLGLTAGTNITATAAVAITPTASFQTLTSAAAITDAVIADGAKAGQLLVLQNANSANYDITILETGSHLDAGGDITLTGNGALDTEVLLWDGTQWVRLAHADN